jgi:hypothetical protein
MLLIEKLVKLLDEAHFEVFRDHLKVHSIRSYYPLALVDVIDRNVEVSQETDELCRKVYGLEEVTEKDRKKFFQLAYYTFRFSAHLIKNYPDYLSGNVFQIQRLINEGQPVRAEARLQILLELAEKIEDFPTLYRALLIQIQKLQLEESNRQTNRFYEQIAIIQRHQQDLHSILTYLNEHFSPKGKPKEGEQPDEHLAFFQQFQESEAFLVRKMARFAQCYVRYYLRHASFYEAGNKAEMDALTEDLEKYDYIYLPFMLNIRPRLAFLQMNYTIRAMDTDRMLEAADHIMEESQANLYWNSFVNLPELFSIGVQASHYVSNYMTSYRDDHLSVLDQKVKDQVGKLRERCEKILENKQLEATYTLRYINILSMYCGLLLLGDEADNRKAIERLESIFVLYQQIPFHSFIDGIYTTLIMAAFNIQDHDKVEEAYRRYKKSTRKKVVNPENDLTILGMYYSSKWLATGRSQYVKKLEAMLEQTRESHLHGTGKLISAVVEYYEIPIELV